jgi:hypothetical protein
VDGGDRVLLVLAGRWLAVQLEEVCAGKCVVEKLTDGRHEKPIAVEIGLVVEWQPVVEEFIDGGRVDPLVGAGKCIAVQLVVRLATG